MILFQKHSGIYSFQVEQMLPISREEAWSFFSNPYNLSLITPYTMHFSVTSPNLPTNIYAGLIITYKVKPLKITTFNWITEITHVKRPYFFVDEQRHGPYRIWHHEHFIQEIPSGVVVRDTIHFKLPLGAIGNFFFPFFIKPKLEKIFLYRQKKVTKLFKD